MELSERVATGLAAAVTLETATLAERTRGYADAARAENTKKAYKADLEHFTEWCAQYGITNPVPADPRVVAAYLANFAGTLAVSTLARRLYALAAIHRERGYPPPTESPVVQAVWSGIKRTHRTAPKQKAPTRTKLITRMLKQLDSPIDTRDRALLLIGFAGAFRRSELVALNVDDITDTEDGLHIAVHRSKSDQEGAGDVVGVPDGSNPATCPVRAWRAWLEVRHEVNGVAEGPAFVSIPKRRKKTITDNRLPARIVATIVKRRAKAAGLGDEHLRCALVACGVRDRGVRSRCSRAVRHAAWAVEVLLFHAGVRARGLSTG